MSLERQVCIAAGSSVVLGAILGWYVHPAFLELSAFVGAGLLFSGINDLVGWAWSWPGCRGTGAAKIRLPVPSADGLLGKSKGFLFMKLLIVGRVAGGASVASRARRLSEDARIVLFKRT